MKLNEKQKKALMIGGAIVVGVWLLWRLSQRRRTGVPMPVDNGSPQAGYATYNVPNVYGTPSGGYTFGDINIGGPPADSAPAPSACCDPCAARAAQNNGSFTYANFGIPFMQGANYTPPLVPYVSGFFQVN